MQGGLGVGVLWGQLLGLGCCTLHVGFSMMTADECGLLLFIVVGLGFGGVMFGDDRGSGVIYIETPQASGGR